MQPQVAKSQRNWSLGVSTASSSRGTEAALGDEEKQRGHTGSLGFRAEGRVLPLGFMGTAWPFLSIPPLPRVPAAWSPPLPGCIQINLLRNLGQDTGKLHCVESLIQHAHVEHLLYASMKKNAGTHQ
jgi:hypothetical protein